MTKLIGSENYKVTFSEMFIFLHEKRYKNVPHSNYKSKGPKIVKTAYWKTIWVQKKKN